VTPSEVWFVAAFCVSVWIRSRAERLSTRKRVVASPHVWMDRLLPAGMSVGCVVLPVAYLSTNWLAVGDRRQPPAASGLGAALAVASLVLLWKSHVDLDDNWTRTVALKERHVLVTAGVDGLVRHPMYLALWLLVASQALLLHNWIAGLAGLAAFAPMYVFRVPREEGLLRQQFGRAHASYCRRTPKHLPALRRRP
jgi:protein-S-isoprenylcysteine O-methyltransferase Ste14